mmetsp:Transcript_52904/g.72452  ORF Transcript_52904/g.72452 Transcript_52904/m.72452 type:complete len:250 (+) Transcript_52904:1235-1984(+)
MDPLMEEGIFGTTDGCVYYISFSPEQKDSNTNEYMQVKLISRACKDQEKISVLRYDPQNSSVFMSSCGTSNGDVKLYTSQHVDKITTHYANCGSVKFITSEPKNRKTRIIGHQYGDLEFYNVDTLRASPENYRLDLEDGEEITCGTYSQNGLNFAVGTSFGSIFILGKKKEKHYGKVSNSWQVTRVDSISNDQENAVTSIKLSVFDPTGALLVAFDDGKVRVWKSKVKDELVDLFNEMKNNKKKKKDIP